jgi:homoserine dehydrogenase
VGPLMLYGRGAGGDPTATSVVGDLIELARSRRSGVRPVMPGHPWSTADEEVAGEGAAEGSGAMLRRRVKPIDDLQSQYYVVMRVADRPGVLAAIATAFASHEVSIKSVWQEGHGDEAQIVLITHRAAERALQACVSALKSIESVGSVGSVLRVEGGDP